LMWRWTKNKTYYLILSLNFGLLALIASALSFYVVLHR
jgi:hypothetical protein